MKLSPASILFLLVAIGGVAALFVAQKPDPLQEEPPGQEGAPPQAAAPLEEPAPPVAGNALLPGLDPLMPVGAATVPGLENPDDLRKQIKLLEGQVEYLQGQVDALQQDNALLLQKLGSLGMKGVPKMDTPPARTGAEADFVGMGVEMMKFRHIQALPVPTTGASEAEVERVILAWLRQQMPDDEAPRFGLALAALGWIEKPVDPLPLRAALMTKKLGGWFDAESGTLLVADEQGKPGQPAPDRPLAITYGQLLREFGPVLFPPRDKGPLSTDERLAREALLAGDAGLTRFLFSLQSPEAMPKNDLPSEDPDHPLNTVPIPVFLKELSLFPYSRGFDFAQALHSAGQYDQLSAAYSRPPVSCAEVIQPEKYLDEARLPPVPVEYKTVEAAGSTPYWDDRLGKYAAFTAMRAYNNDEDAGQAVRGWKGDRLLAYAAPEAKRDHACWQTLWLTPADADAFFKAMRNTLTQRYNLAPAVDTAAEVVLRPEGREVRLLKNREGTGVLLIDAANAAFADALKAL